MNIWDFLKKNLSVLIFKENHMSVRSVLSGVRQFGSNSDLRD